MTPVLQNAINNFNQQQETPQARTRCLIAFGNEAIGFMAINDRLLVDPLPKKGPSSELSPSSSSSSSNSHPKVGWTCNFMSN